MDLMEALQQVRELLQKRGRITYRLLQAQFHLDNAALEAVREELIEAEQVAVDENGKVLVWVGNTSPESRVQSLESTWKGQAPIVQTLDPRRQTLDSYAERRQLTVMFCDLVGSTALSEQLDPEEYHTLVRTYQATCTTVIQRYAGYIAQHLGDGLLVYFGYPLAHEDEAQRAVRTGLEIAAALPRLNEQIQATVGSRRHDPTDATAIPPLQVRIGIHTGLVVIGEIGSSEKREILALGETPNIAARLQSLAEPDTVALSAVTQRLIVGLFECQDLGLHTLKGISTPLSVYRVIRESEAQSRFEVALRKGLTPLVGREEELGLLRRRWEQVKVREGQVVLLSGEPGIGKSRLVQTLKEQVTAEGATHIEFRCSPYHQNSAFYPIIEHLQRLLQFEREDSPPAKLTKLQQTLAAYRFPQVDTLPLLATLLSLPQLEDIPPLTLSPQKQKQKTQEALVAWLVEEAERTVMYCAWEDLHWADPSTLELLTLYLEQIPTTRIFTMLTCRPEFTPPWGPRSYLTQLTLSRLGRPHVESIVEKVAGEKVLPSEVLQQIIAKTDGVPLFVEELTKSVIETVGAHSRAPLQSLAIPTTLHDALMARLDRLAPIKEIAQLGATLGREFSYELLHAISPLDEAMLQQGLRQLVEAELLYQRGLLPQTIYLFKHALIQDAAYQSLLKSRRQQLHQQIAQVLEQRFKETVETHPELLAHHYTEANLIEQAIPYWQQAGQRAAQRSAYTEAVAHLTRGLELLTTLPDTPERVQQELTLQLALGEALAAVKGYAASEVEKTMLRAQKLCQQLGETPQLIRVLQWLTTVRFARAEHQTARELAEQCLSLAQRRHSTTFLAQAHFMLSNPLYALGEFVLAHDHQQQAIPLYDRQEEKHSLMSCLSWAAWTLWYLGYPDQGLKRSAEALALVDGLSRPFSRAYALVCAAKFHLLRREEQLARERAEEVIPLSTEQGFPYWLANGTMYGGRALAEQEEGERGIKQLREGLAAMRAIGTELSRPYYLALLAEAHGKAGQIDKGLSVLAEALVVVNKTGECVHEAELYRLKGELTLQQFKVQGSKFKVEEAEECFRRAIDVARRQHAKSLELRATVSLARLWQQQGKRAEAHTLLSEIYGWFTEGFDTKDLQEAKALIEELSH